MYLSASGECGQGKYSLCGGVKFWTKTRSRWKLKNRETKHVNGGLISSRIFASWKTFGRHYWG